VLEDERGEILPLDYPLRRCPGPDPGLAQKNPVPASPLAALTANVTRGGPLRPPGLAPNPLGYPHPQLRLVADRLGRRDLLGGGNLIGTQSN
jgi:hypothetical protein